MWIGKAQWQELQTQWHEARVHALKTNEEMGQVQQDTTLLKVAVGKVKTSVDWLKWLMCLLVAGLIGFAFCVLKSVLP